MLRRQYSYTAPIFVQAELIRSLMLYDLGPVKFIPGTAAQLKHWAGLCHVPSQPQQVIVSSHLDSSSVFFRKLTNTMSKRRFREDSLIVSSVIAMEFYKQRGRIKSVQASYLTRPPNVLLQPKTWTFLGQHHKDPLTTLYTSLRRKKQVRQGL